MGTLFYLARTFLITFFVVLVLQIRIGSLSLEERALGFIRQSALVAPLQTTALDIVQVMQSLWAKTKNQVDATLSPHLKGARDKVGTLPGRLESLTWERSPAYHRDAEARRREATEEPTPGMNRE